MEAKHQPLGQVSEIQHLQVECCLFPGNQLVYVLTSEYPRSFQNHIMSVRSISSTSLQPSTSPISLSVIIRILSELRILQIVELLLQQ